MRLPLHAAFVLACLIAAHRANAQPPLALPSDPLVPAPQPPAFQPPRPAFQEEFEPLGRRAAIIAGLPLGVRIQTPITGSERVALLAEGTGGLYLIFPTAHLGLRCELAPYCTTERRLTIAPGLGVYGVYNILSNAGGFLGGGPRAWFLGAADVDLAWHRSLGNTEGLLGIKLGIAAGGSNGAALPLAAVFAGWRF